MKVYGFQHDIIWEDQAANCRRVTRLLEETKPEPDSLVVLPEMFASGFTMNTEASRARAETMDALAKWAACYRVYVLAGVVSTDVDRVSRNEAILWQPDGSRIGRYVKQQGFTMGGESTAYASGDSHTICAWLGHKVAPFICYDLRFPEVFRPAAADGAELMVVIASWPDKRIEHWTHLLRARAIENQCYVVGVNRVGADPSLNYNGQSRIFDYHGNALAEAGDGEEVISADLDFGLQAEYRGKLPFLKDM